MLEPIGFSSRQQPDKIGSLATTPALLRIGAGLVLLIRHGWSSLLEAYQFVWNETPWNWITVFAEEGVPLPGFAAPAAALFIFLVALFWIVGFLTRLSSAAMISLVVPALLYAEGDYPVFSELCWLYLLISFSLLISGSGAFSLDRLLKRDAKSKGARHFH